MKQFYNYLLALVLLAGSLHSQTHRVSICSSDNGQQNIQISRPHKLDDFDFCPGCQKSWYNGNYCLTWEVSTNKTPLTFQAIFQNPPSSTEYTVDWVWMYQDDLSGEWKRFDNDKYPTGAPGHLNNLFTIEGKNANEIRVIRFRVCITQIITSCSAQSKTNNLDFNVTVNCES